MKLNIAVSIAFAISIKVFYSNMNVVENVISINDDCCCSIDYYYG